MQSNSKLSCANNNEKIFVKIRTIAVGFDEHKVIQYKFKEQF